MAKKLFILLMLAVSCLTITGCGDNDSINNAPDPAPAIKITTISEIGTIPTGDSSDVVASGNKLYYTGGNDLGASFGIVNFSDPDNPAILSTMDVGSAFGIDFDGRYAFVQTDGQGDGLFANGTVGVIDCLNPRNPVEVTENNLGYSSAFDIEIKGNYLYNFSSDRIGVYDISHPRNITHIQNVNVGDAEFGKIVGKYLYTGNSNSSELVIYDISAPTVVPIPVAGRLAIPSAGHGATAIGTTAFIAGGALADDRIYSVDVSDPANPLVISSIVTPSYIGNEMRILGNYLLAVGFDEFVVIDISDPLNMILVGSVPVGNGWGRGFDVSGKYAIVTDDTVLRIIKLY